ncbi:MAG TPA: YggT family protein [Acidobacteria bacterium]|nr:YggT family protein [Acidobacteriota bacterium]
MLLIQLLDIYSLLVFGSVIISWVKLPPDNPIASFLHSMTEPLLSPIRKIMPEMGGLDVSPLVLLFGIRLVRGVIISALL